MNPLKVFILNQINSYEKEFEKVRAKVIFLREDLETEEDVIVFIEELNLIEGIIEGMNIVLKKINEMEKVNDLQG